MEQLPDGRWHWERGQTQPLCYECKAVCDLYRYKHNGDSLYFCSTHCADKWAAENNAEADHSTRTIYDREPYNGAAYGYSPYDLMDFECRSCRGTTARSVSLSWGAREVGSPCEWRGGARHCSRAMGGDSGLETC